MQTITTIEIKKGIYCNAIFYSLYIDKKLHKNFKSLKEVDKGLAKLLLSVSNY